jgi:hypothetical protein
VDDYRDFKNLLRNNNMQGIHTVKAHLMVNNHGDIIHKTENKKGKRHDYDIYKKNHSTTPKHVVSVFDLGYPGVEKDHPDQKS